MPHNFDNPINNNQQHSVKHDAKQQFFGTEDILPLWVADGLLKEEWRGLKVPGHVDEVLKSVKALNKLAA